MARGRGKHGGGSAKSIMDMASEILDEWALRIVVLVSFVLQVVLFLFAGVRRRRSCDVRRTFVWISYQLAEHIAKYGLGLFKLSCPDPERQQVVALWAPLLLLHLSGPDTIAAYALEDNNLGRRRLGEGFLPQVVAVAYILSASFPEGCCSCTGNYLHPTAWLLFAVAFVKNLERLWALDCGTLGSIRDTVRKQKRDKNGSSQPGVVCKRQCQDPDDLLLYAHSQFPLCRAALVDSSWVDMDMDTSQSDAAGETIFSDEWGWKEKFTVFQMELSLLYDIIYTKARVIHTWYGYCIRLVSPVATFVALLLFHLSDSSGCTGGAPRADVGITCFLLVGANVFDAVPLVTAAGSSWAYAVLVSRRPRCQWLYHRAVCSGKWHRLRRWLVRLRRLLNVDGRRNWSGAIGQHNLLQLSKKNHSSTCTCTCTTVHIPEHVMELVFKNMVAIILRLPDSDDADCGTEHSSSNSCCMQIVDPGDICGQPTQEISSCCTVSPDLPVDSQRSTIKADRGQLALLNHGLTQYLERYIRDEIQEQILIWHIATDIYLAKNAERDDASSQLVEAVKLVSNYIMFLLVERPSMVPGLALLRQYEATRDELLQKNTDGHKDADNHGRCLVTMKNMSSNNVSSGDRDRSALPLASRLASKLLKKPVKVKFLFDMWMEMLLFVSHRCSSEAHAKQLSKGGELTTIVWLMAKQAGKFYTDKRISGEDQDDGSDEEQNDPSETFFSNLENLEVS
uniref:DUF4220 domain-containing protein n=2 Tax=Oryza brachyantha TaxID=4533 RepID=A0A0U1WYN2_ORYBR|nr:hypothetical protein [Oryza brachyantha]